MKNGAHSGLLISTACAGTGMSTVGTDSLGGFASRADLGQSLAELHVDPPTKGCALGALTDS